MKQLSRKAATSFRKTEHFEVRTSSIEGAGQGLFSRVIVGLGETIGEYTGIVLSDNQVNRAPYVNSQYVLWVCKDCNIVGEGPLANHTRYINHHDYPNARMVCSTRWKKARIEATKIIRPGQEIFINYGPYYWEMEA